MHIESVHKDRKYKCNLCDFQTSSESYVRTHRRAEHEGVVFRCQLCDYQSKVKTGLTIHIKSKHEGKKFSCNECNYNATTKKSAEIHMESRHQGKIYSCKGGNYTSYYADSVNRHRKAKNLQNFNYCSHCDYKSLWHNVMMRHVNNMHIGVIQAKQMRVNLGFSRDHLIFNCLLCNFTSMSEKELGIHEKNSHAGVLYLCADCDQQAEIEHKVNKIGFLADKLKRGNCERQPIFAYFPDGYKQRTCQNFFFFKIVKFIAKAIKLMMILQGPGKQGLGEFY